LAVLFEAKQKEAHMLEGRGIDFESIGFAQGVARAVRNIERNAEVAIQSWQREAARHEAHAAGRHAQMRALLTALREFDPDHPALDNTGLVWPCGTPALAYELVYEQAYDDVAKARGIALSTSPMTPADRAAHRVLSEPIKQTSFLLFWTRWQWRGDEYRSRQGAERSRQRAADLARKEAP
jgi:hypothetical protein